MKSYASLVLILVSGLVGHADEFKKPLIPDRIKQFDAEADPVKGPELGGVYGTGMWYARPTRGRANSGILFKTDELHLVVGNFQDDTKYSGNTIEVSTKSHDVFEQIDKLDQSKHYVFNYWYAYPFHFNMEDTSYKVTSVSESIDPGKFLDANLPTGFDVKNGRTGNQSGPAETNGRMVEVFRWKTYLLNRPICSFTLDSGGSRRTSEGPVANEITYNVYSEQGCRYLETILPYGLELKVTFTQSYLTIDGYDHTAEHVVVDSIPGMAEHPQTPLHGVGPITEELLQDPAFQDGINKLIDERWKKLHP